MNSRCQVDLIDFQTQPDGNFKFIMVYQDHLTKFVLLRALQCKRAAEVAYHLNDIFLTIGMPCILQSDNGREFVNNVISELARHSQSQGSVERANQDIENMIGSWMNDNVSTKWSEEPRVGLSTSPLPQEIINDIQDEDDLRKVIKDDRNVNLTEDRNDNVVEVSNREKVSSSENDIHKARTTAAENLVKHAKKMKATSDKSHPPANIEDNVTVPIPDVDKGKGDLRNIIGVILQKNDESILSEFGICNQTFLEVTDVNQGSEISLRTAATKHSVGSGQGFVRCSCYKNCSTNRCQCKKALILCNYKCHQSKPCKNK
ncbi:KRAB-A domain-containing protein 2-like [Melitaea cinxia]|uniref:KRAB-A domain-containing protein 2-like n=1 Tax=Melitaea cinxia TaxID=113334 RepID=UPI001E2724C8|nr:KRAB-A domain-containing protein 2-like [Melitaea cinxia]